MKYRCLAVLTAIASLALTAHGQVSVPGLTHRYNFATNANDLVGTANGTLQGGAVVTNGALVLNGVSGTYLSLPANLMTNYTNATFEAWVTDNGGAAWSRIFDFNNGTSNYIFLSLPAGGGNLRAAYTTNNAAGEQLVEWPVNGRPTVNQKAHIVLASDGVAHVGQLWVNGVLVGSNNALANSPLLIGPTPNDWLGRSAYSGDPYFLGSIDEFRIYNTVLSSNTIIQDFQAGPNKFLLGPIVFVQQPQGTNVTESRPVTLVADVDGAPPYSLQWYRNGAALTNQTNLTLSFNAAIGDNNASYQLLATNSYTGTNYSAASSNATLTVVPDTNPPVLVNAQSATISAVNVFFSEPISTNTATNLANYTLTGPGGAVSLGGATLDPTGSVITLSTQPLLIGSNYTLTVSGLRDRSSVSNLIAPGSQASFVASAYTLLDIGSPAVNGGFQVTAGGLVLTAGGTGIGGTADQFSFAYQAFTGDFDVQMQLGSLGLSDLWASAGLMARDGLATNSAFAASFATPGPSGCFFESRTNVGATSVQTGFFPVNYPNTWLRLKRAGNLFTGYASLDGLNWTALSSATLTLSGTLEVGIAVSSHNAAQTTSASFTNAGNTASANNAAGPLPFEPIGPSSRHTGLVISEIMYHPQNLTSTNSYEFVELYNSDLTYEDLSGSQLAGSISYTFPPGTILASGAYLVVARDPASVSAHYGITGVLGPYANNLPNSSGTVQLLNELGSVFLEVDYDTSYPWPIAPDGVGHSLVLRRPSYGENDPRAWAASDTVGGTPGTGESYGSEPLRPVVINEFLAHTDLPNLDTIELFNTGSQPLNIGGCTLSDDPDTNKFIIPTNTMIPARGFVYFDQTQLGFRLAASGETIYLKNPALTRVLDTVRYEAQENGVSFGRYPDGGDQWYRLSAKTFGASNAPPLLSQVGINEIMYDPISGLDDDQYVELYNHGTNAVNLGGWSFSSGISYTFPSNTIIPANGYLVVAKNMTRLFGNYTNLTTNNTVGNFGGKLSHNGERLALAKPDTQVSTNGQGAATTNLVAIVVDELTYGVDGRWGQWSAGGGSSLELVDPRADKRFAPNWADSDETAKAPWTLFQRTDIIDLGMSTTGNGAPNRFEMMTMDSGECLVDDLELRSNGGTNYITNPGFEQGTNGWAFQGTFTHSQLETSLAAFSGANSLHVYSVGGGDTGANRIRTAVTALPVGGTNQATLRARVRWLKGDTNFLMRVRGNWLECAGGMTVPANLGTPGLPNSRLVTNAGPAIVNVTHFPILPATNQAVTVTARISDPDGVASATLFYRIDPSTSYTAVPMLDDGTGGDAFANDGIYSATIPAPATSAMVAFYVQAQDANAAPAAATFPSDAPARECLIKFGETLVSANMGTYRLWLTQSNINYWTARAKNSNETLDTTFAYGNWRVIYNAASEYSGSPWHTPSYNGPLGSFACNYVVKFPADDAYLANTRFVLESQSSTDGNTFNNDASAQAETTAHWFARKLGLRPDYRRYVLVFMNGQQRGLVYFDYQKPRREQIKEYFPNDGDGQLLKIDDWFEFDDAGSGQSIITAKLLEHNLNGQKRTEDYRWSFAPDGGTPPNDFTNFYALVDAVNAPAPQPYTGAVTNLINIRQWMRVFALEHMAGDWDSFGYRRGKNMYAYKPTAGPWEFMLYDIQLDFGKSSDGTTQPLFDVGNTNDVTLGDPLIAKMYGHPPFVREFWGAMQELATNWMLPQVYTPLVDARVAALRANGVAVEDPASIKTWIAARRSFILPQIPQAPFSVSGPASFSSSTNNVTVSGTAPIGTEAIVVNGVSYPLTWTSVTNWSINVQLGAGANSLLVQALDGNGSPIANGFTNVTVNYSGPAVSPAGNIVINEIMHHPTVDGAEYIELFNTHSNFSFDLSGWDFKGLGYTFPTGSSLPPRGFLVLAKDRYAFAAAYGVTSNTVFDEFAGTLSANGETLSLVQPGIAPTNTVAEVRYETNAPWPPAAVQPGVSLQLIDAAQDNWRVGNWAVGLTNPPPPVAQWVHVTATGTASSSTLYVYLQSAGDIYVDDLQLVAGGTPEVGSNTIANGGFETAFPGSSWNVSTNLTGSARSTAFSHSGTASLQVVATSGGTTQSNAIFQNISPALTNAATYTLSYWYLQNTNGGPLTIRLSGSGIVSTVSPAVPATSPSLASTPGAGNSVAASLPAFPPLWLNELQADNLTGITNSAGQHAPWLELYNPGTNVVSLNGLYLANDYSNLTNWPFPSNAVINAGQFKIIFADGQTNLSTTNELHASFTLPGGTGSLALSRVYSNQPQVLDYINYVNVTPNHSYGSFPDGQSFTRQEFFFVTPGGTNNGVSAPLTVSINEWMADNKHTIFNPVGGKADDWFELYNYGSSTADLSGFYLTDNLTNKFQVQIAPGYTIPPHGFLIVWADNTNSTNTNSLHVNFALSKSGEAIGLFAADGTPVDTITFGPQTTDVTQGRYPDGGPLIYFMNTVTPGTNNFYSNAAPVLAVISNRVVTLGQTLSFTAGATDIDAPPQALAFSLAGGAPGGAGINPANGLFTWTPPAAPATNSVSVMVADNGTPVQTATQTFQVTVVPPPPVGGTAVAGNQFALNWQSVAGTRYQVVYKDDLNVPGWLPLGSPIIGTGGMMSATNSTTSSTNRFFTLQILP